MIVMKSSEFIKYCLPPIRELVFLGKGGRIKKRSMMHYVIGNIVREGMGKQA